MYSTSSGREPRPHGATDRGDLLFVFGCLIASRAILEGVGWLTAIIIRPRLNFPHVWTYSTELWLSIWGVSDTGWFLDVARHGYQVVADPATGWANWAFFPAYPMISRGLSDVSGVPLFVTMVIVSNLAFVAALWLIRREAEWWFDRSTARWTVVLLCVLPGTHVFSSAYSESLYLLAMTVSLSAARRRMWLAAGAAGAVAALTRNIGVATILPMMVLGFAELRQARGEGDGAAMRVAARVGAGMAMPVAALAGYCVFLWSRTGDPFAFATVQKAWSRTPRIPFSELVAKIAGTGDIDLAMIPNWVAGMIAVILLVHLARARQWALLAYGLPTVLVPLATGPISFHRFAIADLPLVMMLAWICRRNEPIAPTMIAILAIFEGFMMVGWATGLPYAN